MPALAVLPSLLSCDFANLGAELTRVKNAGCQLVHVDVMDGHFVPNLTIGPVVVQAMRRVSDLHLDVHLMLTDPMRYAEDFVKSGASAITIHVEAVGQRRMDAAIKELRRLGCRVGLSFNPDTDPRLWAKYFHQVDLVMFMTVYPGFGGQSYIPEVATAIQFTRQHFPQLDIQVDGGINRQTAPIAVAAGANRLVIGSAWFQDADPAGLTRWCEQLSTHPKS